MEPLRLVREGLAPPAPQPGNSQAAARGRHRLTLVLDPRFPGGTAAAAAAEVRALAGLVDLEVAAIETAMLRHRSVNSKLTLALEEAGIPLRWDLGVIRADTVVFHNPSCLKFDRHLPVRLSCDTAIIVTHENFLRPDGSEGFDVGACLGLLDKALIAGRRMLAPVSPYNRRGVETWNEASGGCWTIAEEDWFNICNQPVVPPTDRPRDRRGRHSRPGLEKFPGLEVMHAHFPPHAERCRILGADTYLSDGDEVPRHWDLHRFGEMDVAEFLAGIDFFVYFTNPLWRESFGRVIAEAIAAGKVVITDPGTAEVFGDAVVRSEGTGDEVDTIIRRFIAAPDRYRAFVRAAQATLARFSPEAFARRALRTVAASGNRADAVL